MRSVLAAIRAALRGAARAPGPDRAGAAAADDREDDEVDVGPDATRRAADYRPGLQLGERCPACAGTLVRYYTRGEAYRAATRRHFRYAPRNTDISDFVRGYQYVCDGCGHHW